MTFVVSDIDVAALGSRWRSAAVNPAAVHTTTVNPAAVNPAISNRSPLPEPHVLPDVVVTTTPIEDAHPYLALVHPEDRESLAALVELAALSDAHAIVRVRDDRRWALVEHRVRDEHDHVVLERIDVTEREQQRARQGRTDAYWRTIVRNGHEAIAVLDPETYRIRHASDHLGELLETLPIRLERRSVMSMIHPDDEAVFAASLDRLDGADGRLVIEVRLVSHGAEPRWMEAVLSDARHDPDVAAIVVNLRDIEDRKRAEHQLRSSEHLFRVLLGHLADGALVVDNDGIVQFASERAAETLDTQIETIVGRAVPLRRRSDGSVFLSADPGFPVADLTRLPTEIGGLGDRWFEFSLHDLRADPVVDGFVLVFRDVTQRRRDVEQLRHELQVDTLTGLVNRRGFEQQLSARIDRGERLQLAFLDLNGFKAVNDTYGHAVGDELLCRFADRLRQVTRPDDVVARLGGDEFVVAAGSDLDDRHELTDRLARDLSGPYQLQHQRVWTSVSAGWSAVGGDITLAEALNTADERMYADKAWQADLRRNSG